MNLRPYQQTAVDSARDSFARHKSVLLVAATGTGKTVVISDIIKRALIKGKRTIVVAHREELIRQAALKIEGYTGIVPEIEKAENYADFDNSPPVVVSSIQTLNAGWMGVLRMERINPSDYDIVIIDEAHHAVASSYRRFIKYMQDANPSLRLLGVTATPDRGDEIGLRAVFEDCPFRYEINDAVNDGWLVPIRQRYVTVGSLDYSTIRTRMGDLCGKDLHAVLEEEKNLHGMVHPTLEILGDKQAIIFCASVRQAELVAQIINRHKEGAAACVSGSTESTSRQTILAGFADGSVQFVTNVGVLTEGFDAPGCHAVVMMTATKVRAKYVQCVGRATRPNVDLSQTTTAEERKAIIASSDKPHCIIIDFKGNSGKHKLVGAVDVLSGQDPGPIMERAKEIIATSGDEVDPLEAVRQAEAEEEMRKESEEARLAEASKRASLKLKASYSSRDVDPFSRFDMTPTHPTDPREMATQKQFNLLAYNGVDATGLTRKQANRIIADIMMRRKRGFPSLKQQAILDKYGLEAQTAQQAKAHIDDIARAGWPDPSTFAGREPAAPVLSGEDLQTEGVLPDVERGRSGERDISDSQASDRQEV
jgi:superfamily II DNA or RNA helicase